jgi:hypothetical protein
VDDAREQLKIDTAMKLTPVWRIDQGIQEVCDTLNGGKLNTEQLGSIIKWVMSDIIKEETITLNESGLTLKEVSSNVSRLVKERFFERYNMEL